MLQYEPCFSSQVNTSQSEIGKVTTLSFTQGGGKKISGVRLSPQVHAGQKLDGILGMRLLQLRW